MSLPELAIRKPVMAWMLMVALIVFGVISFRRLGVSQLPDVDFPVVNISLFLQGAAPEVMESQVVDYLEDSLMQIEGIRTITSNSQQSTANIIIEFELDRNIDQAMQEVQNRINEIKNFLPTDLLPPTIRKINPEDQPIMWIAIFGDDSVKPMDMMIYARNYVFNQFATIPGVGDISLGGYVDPALRVSVDLGKLKKYELTADDVLTAIQREHLEIPAGRIENESHEYNVRVMGEAQNPVDFAKILVSNRSVLGANFRPTRLGEFAQIEEGTADVRRISRFDKQFAVGLGIQKQHGANSVEVAKAVRKKLAELNEYADKHYKMNVRTDLTLFIQQSVDELNFTLILSAILTSLVCYLFLGSWTSTLNVLLAIPTSIVGAFIAFYFMGFTLNTFTLLGLSLAIGIVVDDAIMMLENIVRHRQLGEGKKDAALKGANEITFAALAATVAVVAIFIPVIFMKGVIGRYFFQYGVTVTVAVLLSLLEALTLTPMRCSRYLKVTESSKGLAGFMDRSFHKISIFYHGFLKILLRHRFKTIGIAVALFALSMLTAFHLPAEMIPPQDQSMLLIRIKTPIGSSLQLTDSRLNSIEETLTRHPEVEGVFTLVGGFGGDVVNQGVAFTTLVDPKERKATQSELIVRFRKELKEKLPDTEIVIQDLSLRGFAASRGFPVEFTVQGSDWDKLNECAQKMIEELKNSGTATDINTDVQAGQPEIRIIPDRKKLSDHAVSLNSVTLAINALVGGAVLNGQTEYPKAGHRYEIELRLIGPQRINKNQLKQIHVRNNRGEVVELSDLVEIKEEPSLQLISRLNRSRSITVYANPAPGHSQQEALNEVERISKTVLPQGYYLKLTGSAQSFKESFVSLVFAMLLGILVSYMVLATQFNSFVHPITVLMALPFSLSGAFIGLAFFHQSINIYSLIGLILLMGIVKKNSILLVDFTNQMRSEGRNPTDALLHACPVRLRPIVMTSVATIAGALPAALAFGPGAETRIPMAVAIIGGVAASTVLTLFVVPCVYSLLTNLEKKQDDLV